MKRALHRIAHWLHVNGCRLAHVRHSGHLFITTECATCGEVDRSDMTHSMACDCQAI